MKDFDQFEREWLETGLPDAVREASSRIEGRGEMTEAEMVAASAMVASDVSLAMLRAYHREFHG